MTFVHVEDGRVALVPTDDGFLLKVTDAPDKVAELHLSRLETDMIIDALTETVQDFLKSESEEV